MKLALSLLLATGVALLVWMWIAAKGSPAADSLSPRTAPAAVEHGALPAFADSVRELTLDTSATALPLAQADAPDAPLVRVLARAVTWDGQPVQDAWLAQRQLARQVARGNDEGRLELSLPAGELERFAGLLHGRTVELEVGASGHGTQRVRRSFAEGTQVLELGDLVLAPGAAVEGWVVDEAGRPLAGALVVFGEPVIAASGSLHHAHYGPPDLRGTSASDSTTVVVGRSGPDGSFRLTGLPVGHGTAWARTRTSLWGQSDPIGLRAGDVVRDVELVLIEDPDSILAGVIVDPDGRPVPNLHLRFRSTGTTEYRLGRYASADGTFHVHFRDGAPQDIEVPSPSPEWDDARVSSATPGTHDLVIRFEPSRWLVVAVRDREGMPIESGRVVAREGATAVLPFSPGPRPPALRSSFSLGPDGHARVRRGEGAFRLRISAPGYREERLGPFEPERFPDPLVVMLERVPSLTGKVLLADGSPAVGAEVALYPAGGDTRWAHSTWAGDRESFVLELQRADARTVTDGEGRYRLPLPAPSDEPEGGADPMRQALTALGYGPAAPPRGASANADAEEPLWRVHAELEGHAAATTEPLALDPHADPQLELVLPPAGGIAGRLVLDCGGEPGGWTARASDGLAQLLSTPIASDGSFRLDDLHAGGWQVRVFERGASSPAGGRLQPTDRIAQPDVQVVAGRTTTYEHRASKTPRARLFGQLGIDGAPPGPWRVGVGPTRSWSGPDHRRTSVDPDGRFEVTLPPAEGAWILLHTALGAEPSCSIAARIDLHAGDNTWSFDLETATLAGTVDPALLPAGQTAFLVYEAQPRGVLVEISLRAVDGRFGPVQVPAGTGAVRGPRTTWMGGPGELWAELDIGRGEVRELDLR